MTHIERIQTASGAFMERVVLDPEEMAKALDKARWAYSQLTEEEKLEAVHRYLARKYGTAAP